MFRTIFQKSKCKTLAYRCRRCGHFKTPDSVLLDLQSYAVTTYKKRNVWCENLIAVTVSKLRRVGRNK